MNLRYLSFIIILICGLKSSVTAQTANDQVPPYPSEIFFGTNMGYFPGWTDEDLATISKGDPAKGVEGLGTETLRPALFGHFLEQWGYDARIAAFKYYQSIGIKDYTFLTGFLDPGQEGSWWDNNPDPCEYKMRAPVFHYIRTLRIAYEVIKQVQPDALVATGGVGYPSFVDAICRNTDNPNDGKVTTDYPLGGGAYFDVLSFHCYPHIDGSLKKWNMSKFRHDLFRHTDKAAQGVVDAKKRFEKVLKKYGYNGQKFPEKHWILTEVNIPRIPINNQLGSDKAQRNFIIKSVVLSKRENIRQYHIYNLAEASRAHSYSI